MKGPRQIRLVSYLHSALLLALVPPAVGQETAPGVKLNVNAAEISIGGRVHTQFNTTTVDSASATEWLLRRVRLEATVRVNEIVSGKVQPDFAGDRVSLRDAFLKLDFSPGFQVLAGKAWRPFGLLEQTSSNRILPIERGARIRGIVARDEYQIINGLQYSDRDIGLQLMGEPGWAPLGFTYAVGVFRGPLQDAVEDEETFQVASRFTVEPAAQLRLGAGWSSRDFAARVGGQTGDLELRRGNAFEIDVEFGAFRPGPHLLGEFAFGDANPFTGDDFWGAQAWLGYRTGEVSRVISTIEPILRISHGSLERSTATASAGEQGGTLVTPGINLWLGGLNRVMFNYDLWAPSGNGGTEGSFKAMFQFAF